MYALENVKKFVQDNAGRLGKRAEEILACAEGCSENGVFSGGAVENIMQDDTLASEFHQVVMSDSKHIEIGLSALQSAR